MRPLLLLLGLCLVACSTEGPDDDDVSDDDDATDDDDWRAGASCDTAGVSVSAEGSGFRVTTDEYSMYVEVSEAEAEAMGAILAAAFDAFEGFFTQPAGPLPMQVELYATEAAWGAAIEADGLAPPWGAGGLFHTATGKAYLFVQPTRYFTRMLLLHEVAHQFHAFARTGGASPGWYAEGTAEYLSRHHWDGACLALGIRPLLTEEDRPAAALDWTAVNGFPLGDILDGVAAGRPEQLTVFRYFEAATPDAWQSFKDVMDTNPVDPRGEFEALFGPTADYEQPILDHLAADQEPMTPIFLEWSHIEPAAVEGWSPYFSLARVKGAPSRFEATFTPRSDDWAGGVVVGWDSYDDWLALVASSDGRLWTFDVQAGDAVWWDQGAAPEPNPDGSYTVVLTHDPLLVEINGQPWSTPTSLTPTAGPALDNATLLFEDLSWE